MWTLNGIKTALNVKTCKHIMKCKKTKGKTYAIKMNSGCIEICQFRISFDTLLPPNDFQMFNVENLRIYWRNKSILVPFDVIDGETDVIDFDDSMLGE